MDEQVPLRLFDYVTVICEDKHLEGSELILSRLASRLICAEGRQTRIFLKLVLSQTESKQEKMFLDCAIVGNLTLVGLHISARTSHMVDLQKRLTLRLA